MVRENKHDTGFTLVEMLIVITLLAMLAILAIMSFIPQIRKGDDATRKSDINRIKVAAEEYEKDHNCYPPPTIIGCNPGAGLQPYLNKIPCDPTTNQSYVYVVDNNTCPTWYKFYTILQNTSDSSILPGIGPGDIYNYVSGSANAPPDVSYSNSNYFGCVNGTCVHVAGPSSCKVTYGTLSSCQQQCSPTNACN